MTQKTEIIGILVAGLCSLGTAYARPASYCTSNNLCMAKIKRVNVNRGDASFTLKLAPSKLDNLPCAAGDSVVNFRLPTVDEGNQQYAEMFRMAVLGATRKIPVQLVVGGGAHDCQVLAIALSFGHRA